MSHGSFIPLLILGWVAYFEFVQIHLSLLIWSVFGWAYSNFSHNYQLHVDFIYVFGMITL